MSDKEKEEVVDFMKDMAENQNKKLNRFLTIATSIAIVFVSIAVTFMIKNSRENGEQNVKIAHLEENQIKIVNQLENTVTMLGKMHIIQKTQAPKFTEIDKILDNIENRIKNAEFSILTQDPIHVRGGKQNKDENKN